MSTQNNQKGAGTTVGIIIVIIVLILGAVYFFYQNQARQAQIQALNDADRASADDLASIDADAAAMNFDNVDQGVDQIQ